MGRCMQIYKLYRSLLPSKKWPEMLHTEHNNNDDDDDDDDRNNIVAQ